MLFDLQFSKLVFIPRAQPHAQSLFLFPILVFGIKLIHFSMGRRVQPNTQSLVRFFDHFSRQFRERQNEECDFYKDSEFFGNGKCERNANFSATMVVVVVDFIYSR